MAQVETRVGSEGDGRVKTAVEQLVANIKVRTTATISVLPYFGSLFELSFFQSKNLPAAQKVLRENNEADRNMAINK